MKVKIGPYKNYFGPYQLAELLCFWVKSKPDKYLHKQKPEWVHKFGEWLAHGSIEPEPKVGDVRKMNRERPKTWLYRLMLWVDSKRKRTIKVHIDRWDTWSMDDTLAHVILPMLKQFKAIKHGSPYTDDDDVPENLRRAAASPVTHEWGTDDNHHARWDWILDEMIFAFETKAGSLQDWEDQFHKGTIDFAFKVVDSDGTSEMIRSDEDTSSFDRDGYTEYQTRISNGFRLFGKYYDALRT